MNEATSSQRSQSLSRQILVKVLLFGTIIVAAATVVSYYYVYNRSADKTLAYLRQYMIERSRHENKTFSDAHERLVFFRDEFMKLYLSDIVFTADDFWKLYFTDKDGATRMKIDYYQESYDARLGRQWGVSGFVGANQPVDSRDFQRRLIISHILVNRYGPAWHAAGALHVTYPENAVVIYYPEEPWGLRAKPDLPMNELGTIKATLQSTNPERKPVWTGLYYDETAGNWTITYETPVDHEGRHLFNPSLDVRLEAIMNRLITEHPHGAYNFIIRADGYLVAHPGDLREEQKWQGQLSLDKIKNPDILRMYYKIRDAAAASSEDIYVIEDREGGNYLLTARLAGPDWWFVMVYPRQLISQEAHQASRIVLLLGFTIFVLFYSVIYYVVDKKVRLPLRSLQQAVSLVAQGKYDEVAGNPRSIPVEQKNEIGRLAGAFLNMSVQVRDINLNLENIVASRTKELEDANAKLRTMSLLDGLTGIHNRRSFDRDVQIVFQQAINGVESFCLMMADIDFFKNYNDRYGHLAGDEALRKVSEVIASSIRNEDRVYRYGGEEFAVIFNNADQDSARIIGERILESVREIGLEHAGSVNRVVTISGGLVEFNPSFKHAADMVGAADKALYEAKSSGRNCVRLS
ncbi:MAG: diguanylate cyclase [Pseudomonadota bacterium]